MSSPLRARQLAEVQPPVFVADGDDLSVHMSLGDAVRSLEGVDVANGIYQVFDAVGRRITLRADGVREGAFVVDVGTVHVDGAEATPTGATELRRLLANYLRTCQVEVEESADLAALVEAASRMR